MARQVLLFSNDLQQDTARNVGAVLLVDDDEFYPLEDQAPDVSQRDIAAFDRVKSRRFGYFLITRGRSWGSSLVLAGTTEDAGSCQSTFDQ